MLLPQTDRITSRRRFFQYLAASPLVTHIGAPAFAHHRHDYRDSRGEVRQPDSDCANLQQPAPFIRTERSRLPGPQEPATTFRCSPLWRRLRSRTRLQRAVHRYGFNYTRRGSGKSPKPLSDERERAGSPVIVVTVACAGELGKRWFGCGALIRGSAMGATTERFRTMSHANRISTALM
jgi:hypothetical protein